MINKKILAVIPARGGSKGVLRKNMRTIGGKTLIARAIEAAQNSKYLERVLISTDDEDIAREARSLGLDLPFMRPPELATDHAPLMAVVLHAYNFFKSKGTRYEAVLSLQPTCPFITGQTIDNVIEVWLANSCESVVTVAEITKGHPYIAKRLLPGDRLEEFLPIPEGAVVAPRQKREKAYYLTGGMYLRDQRLLERSGTQGHCLGNDARAAVVSQIEAVDINDEFDLEFAEFLVQSEMVN